MASSKRIAKDLTQGSIPKMLLLFTLPFMASNALQVLYSTIDMMVVGHFVGTPGLSAVSQSSLFSVSLHPARLPARGNSMRPLPSWTIA